MDKLSYWTKKNKAVISNPILDFYDGEVQLGLRQCISYLRYKLSAQKVAKFVVDYLSLKKVINTVEDVLDLVKPWTKINFQKLPSNTKIKVQTAWRLKRLNLHYHRGKARIFRRKFNDLTDQKKRVKIV